MFVPAHFGLGQTYKMQGFLILLASQQLLHHQKIDKGVAVHFLNQVTHNGHRFLGLAHIGQCQGFVVADILPGGGNHVIINHRHPVVAVREIAVTDQILDQVVIR